MVKEDWFDLQADVYIEDEDEFPFQSDERGEDERTKFNLLWRDQIIYFKKNKQQLYEEWRNLANEWHTTKNYYNQL